VLFPLICALAAEQLLEARDVSRLSEGQTFLDARGTSIRYRSLGDDRPGPTVVLLNGFVAPLEQWDDVQQRVAAFAPTLAYDRGGLGLSRGSKGADAASQADELLDVLTATRAKRPVVLVCYSSSALIARVFVSRHPELVQGIVFIDPDNPEQILESAFLDHYPRSSPWPARPLPYLSLNAWAYMSGRTLAMTALGLMRFKAWRRNRAEPAVSGHAWRVERFYLLTSHWLAAYREGRARERSARDALAWPGDKTDVPYGVISSGKDNEWPYLRDEFQLHERLVARSTHGILLSVPGWSHNEMVEDPSHVPAVVDMIRSIVDGARPASAR
jgi:pimeloyl-ACP methyl ester carboxylesterase